MAEAEDGDALASNQPKSLYEEKGDVEGKPQTHCRRQETAKEIKRKMSY
jgi:hypothetical protein